MLKEETDLTKRKTSQSGFKCLRPPEDFLEALTVCHTMQLRSQDTKYG